MNLVAPQANWRRAVVYVRVSKGRENMISPEIQETAAREWAAKNRYRIVKVIQDLNKSGRRFEKRAVGQMVDEIREGQYEAVILWKWSRWGRNSVLSGAYLAQVQEAGGEVYSATEDIDPESIIGQFTRDMLLTIAAMESNMKSEGWKETHNHRREHALPHSGAPRFGYDYVTIKGRKTYIVSEETGPILAALYSRALAGTSFRTLSMELNHLGIRNPQGNLFTPQSVTVMLDTGFAAGFIREKSADQRKKYPTQKTLEAFDIWRRGGQETIISEEDFERYKRMRLANRLVAPRTKVPNRVLTGMMKCDQCGWAMVVNYSNGYPYWKCKKKADQGELGCPGANISDIRAMVALRTWLESRAEGEWFPEEAEAAAGAVEADAESLRKQLSDLEGQMKRLLTLFVKGNVAEDHYEEKYSELETQMTMAKSRLDEVARLKKAKKADPRPALQDLYANWETLASPEEQQIALRQVIGRITVLPGSWNPEEPQAKVRILGLWELEPEGL
jgi:DNA invertase Pin-like site-specific DNA recombinase